MEHHAQSSKLFEQPTYSAISSAVVVNARFAKGDYRLEDPIRSLLGTTFSSPSTMRPRTTGNDAAIGIGQAYDCIHRIQAILAYIKIMNGKNPRFGPILDEAKHAYEQALSFYEGRDFEGALEFAAASRELSQVVEIIISRALRSDSLYPTLVLLPPAHQTTLDDSIRMHEELYRVEWMLSSLHCVAENGTLLSEDQKQIMSIASCSERLLRKARHLLKLVEMQEAVDLVHAAVATAHAAEHVCTRWYAMQGIDPFLPPQHTRAMADESSGRDSDMGSRTLELREEQ